MGFFRLIVSALAAIVLLTATVRAADEPEGADAARATIQSQLDAFQDEAVVTAYGYAAPNIQRIFPNAGAFGSMVKNSYPMVWNPSETRFLGAISRGPMIVQRLRIIDQSGRAYIAEYAMLLVDGEWRIAGVEINEDQSFGV